MKLIEPVVSRTRKPRGQGASRRGEILNAANRLFLDEGVQHVTMRRIATAVGVSATALYVYFPDKDSILKAIASEYFAAMLARLEESVRPEQSAPEALRAGLHGYIDFALSHPDQYLLTFGGNGRREMPGEHGKLPEAEMSFALLIRCVQAMIDEGHYPGKSPIVMAEALWACVHGAVAVILCMGAKCESDPKILAEQVVDMAVSGLNKKP
jgi:AcrR family transcriptional regulator